MQTLLLLGTGMIAGMHTHEFGLLADCRIAACADALPGRAAAFAEKNGIAHSFESLDEALAWGGFDAAINATPDAVHKATTLKLVAAGKPVFCEKPLAPSFPDAAAMADAAEAAGLVNMVNLTYRNSPALQEARRMVLAGAIGDLRHLEASYRQSWLVSKAWGDWRTEPGWLWRLSRAHGSTGVLGDVGIHILDFASFGAADDFVSLHADLVTFPKAEGDRIGEYGLDANDSFAMTGRMKGGALATVMATRYATGHANDLTLTLHGTKGALKVETDGKASRLSESSGRNIDKHRWRRLAPPETPRNARRFAEALLSGVNGEPSFRRAAAMQRIIDAAIVSAETRTTVAVAEPADA
jgi:predicted dehydrogenase